jgi:hypothetical protein
MIWYVIVMFKLMTKRILVSFLLVILLRMMTHHTNTVSKGCNGRGVWGRLRLHLTFEAETAAISYPHSTYSVVAAGEWASG